MSHKSSLCTTTNRACLLGITEEPFWTNTLPVDTLTDESIAFLREQLRDCLDQHPRCRQDGGARPTRLLRIKELQSTDGCVCLDDSTQSEITAYVTLSHCWGNVQPIRLTRTTEASLRTGLPVQRLPKTFKEAVHVCRELGVQYIWIDSLCTFQDDLKDWATEAAVMRSVYKNALFNIAASGAPNSLTGLSFERHPPAHQPFQTAVGSSEYWVSPPDWTDEIVSKSPLNRRAWVVQERFLSKRIIHFTTAGPYWECMETGANEVHRLGPPFKFFMFRIASFLKYELFMIEAGTPFSREVQDNFYICWLHILSEYTKCGTTKDTDKLVALKGIAEELTYKAGIGISCGLWRQLIERELLWQVETGEVRTDPPLLLTWRAPSWSWASANYSLSLDSYYVGHRGCVNRAESAKVTKLDVNPLPSGQLVSASLNIAGFLVRARVHVEQFSEYGTLIMTTTDTRKTRRIDSECLVFDRLPPCPYTENLTFIAIMQCYCTEDSDEESDEEEGSEEEGSEEEDRMDINVNDSKKEDKDGIEGQPSIAALVLRRLPTTPTTYSRVGVLRLEGHESCEFYQESEPADREEISIA